MIIGMFKAAPSMALSDPGGTIRRRTAGSQNMRNYECNNQTSGTRGRCASCKKTSLLTDKK